MIRLLQKEAEEDFAVQRAKSSFRFNQVSLRFFKNLKHISFVFFYKEQVKWITYLMDKHGDDFKVNSLFIKFCCLDDLNFRFLRPCQRIQKIIFKKRPNKFVRRF